MAFAVSTIVSVAGLGLAAAGAVTSYSAAKENAQSQKEQLALNQQHADQVNASQLKVQADNVLAVNAQQGAEKISQQQMNLDAQRRQREVIRSSVVARSQAITQEAAAGVTGAGNSVQGGIEGNISGRTGVNLLGTTQNQEAGNAIFGFHQDQLSAYKQAAADGYVPATAQVPNGSGTTAALGAGMTALGGAVGRSEGIINRVGSYFGGSGTSGTQQVGDYTMPTIGYSN